MTDSVYTAHDVSDLINALPACFGFVPEESICVIATSGPRCRFGFRARLDLPPADQVEAAAEHITAHVDRQDADGAITVVLSSDVERAGRAAWAVEEALGRVVPLVTVWADDERYWTTFPDCDPAGYPYVRSLHHLAVVQAVAEGLEVLPSREALVERFAPVTGPRREWLTSALDEVAVRVLGSIAGVSRPDVVRRGSVAVRAILAPVLAGERLADRDLLELCVWTTMIEVRDAVWAQLDSDNARDMLRVWTYVARHAPPPTEPAPLCLAALSAYLLGDGAQALVAVERARSLDPDYTLAGLLLSSLEAGIAPHHLAQVFERRDSA